MILEGMCKAQIVVDHKEIPDFIKATPMGMGYTVKSPHLFRKVKPGDPGKLNVSASMKTIIAIEVTEKE